MKKLMSAVKVLALAGGLILVADIFFQFGKIILHWEVYRYLLAILIITTYTTLIMQSYKTGNMRKLREMILVAVILFMVSVLVYFLS